MHLPTSVIKQSYSHGHSIKLVTYFHDTDNPPTIYGHSEKLCRILSAMLIIQWPYMVIQEKFVTCFQCHWWSDDHIWYISDTIENFQVAQELVRFDVYFLSFILIKWWSNETVASTGLTQVCPNKLRGTQFITYSFSYSYPKPRWHNTYYWNTNFHLKFLYSYSVNAL